MNPMLWQSVSTGAAERQKPESADARLWRPPGFCAPYHSEKLAEYYIPGNLAGDIATDQVACPSGAKPSPFDDERKARGTVDVTRKSATEVVVTANITYTVKDTVDLCPGNCGATLEQVATAPLSQFEATGIAGDVPFTVEFPAPALGSFTISATAPIVTPLPSP
jgi:hypothetical protein